MADIVNRSPFVVDIESASKKNPHPHLTKQFPYKQKAAAVSYAASLMQQGLQPRITQLETSFQVRIRDKGAAAKTLTFPTFAEADAYVTRLESEQKVGLFRDYTEGARTTTAELIRKFILEECPGLKGGATYTTML